MTTPLSIGFKTSQSRATWAELDALWRRAGELDVFDSAWLFDHFYSLDGDGPCFEGMTALAALAPLVPRCRVGHLVLANPYRHPALTVKSAVTLDHITGGRFVLGLGAGWNIPETEAYGMHLDPLGQRLRELRAAIMVIREMLRPEAAAWPADGTDPSTIGGVSIDAPPYRLTHARNDPLPVQRRLPIWLGVQGEQVGLRLVAELADGWTYNGALEAGELQQKLDALWRHMDAVARDPSTVEIAAQVRVDLSSVAAGREISLAFVRMGVQHVVLYLDRRQGTELMDRVATEVVAPLREAMA